MRVVTFTLSGDCFGIPIEDVVFIEVVKNEITKLHNAQEYIKGAVLINGMSIPVYDFVRQFGYAESETAHPYLIVIQTKRTKLGLAIGSRCKIIDVDRTAFQPVPVTANPIQSCFKSILLYQEKLIGLINVERLLPQDAEF